MIIFLYKYSINIIVFYVNKVGRDVNLCLPLNCIPDDRLQHGYNFIKN